MPRRLGLNPRFDPPYCIPSFFYRLQPNAYAHGPKAEAGSYAQGGWYDGKRRVAKAGWGASATTGRAEGEADLHRLGLTVNARTVSI